MPETTFPRVRWRVEIQGLAPADFDGYNIRPKPYGLFITHPKVGDQVASRMSFFPWHKVIRAYQIGENERDRGVTADGAEGLSD